MIKLNGDDLRSLADTLDRWAVMEVETGLGLSGRAALATASGQLVGLVRDDDAGIYVIVIGD